MKLKIKNKHFLVNEATNLHHKILSHVLDNYNEVHLLHHGNDYCFNDNKIGYILNYGNAKKVFLNN